MVRPFRQYVFDHNLPVGADGDTANPGGGPWVAAYGGGGSLYPCFEPSAMVEWFSFLLNQDESAYVRNAHS